MGANVLKLLENAKKDCNVLEIILVLGFCPLKVEIAGFPIGFRLKSDIIFFTCLPCDEVNFCPLFLIFH